MSETSSRLRGIALALAAVAVVFAVVATIVVVKRGSPPGDPPVVSTGSSTRKVAVLDVAELEREVSEPVSENGQVIGVKITDASLRGVLGLAPTDVITGISGRPVRRSYDITDALTGAMTMKATALFVEMMRDGAPHLARWDLDGDLRLARRGRAMRPPAPSLKPVRDPLLDSVKEIDDHHFSVPRATVEQIAANISVFAQGARVFPAMKFGRTEGLRLFIVRMTSALWVLGLRNGDTLQSVNDVVIDDPARLREIYDKVKDSPLLRIRVMRRGASELIEITQTP